MPRMFASDRRNLTNKEIKNTEVSFPFLIPENVKPHLNFKISGFPNVTDDFILTGVRGGEQSPSMSAESGPRRGTENAPAVEAAAVEMITPPD